MPEERKLKEVDWTRGVYEHFAAEFLDHYGAQSLFVRAASDLFTRRAADLMRKSKPGDVPAAARDRANATARIELDHLTERVRGGTPLWREAMGLEPIGTLAQHVDRTAGRAVFERWLFAFEAERFADARALLPIATAR